MRHRSAHLALFASVGVLSAVLVPGPAVAAAAEVYGVPANGVWVIRGHGWGHGHGLSQWGAEGAAMHGVDAATILSTYYPGTHPATYPSAALPAKRGGRIRVLVGSGSSTVVTAQPGLRLDDMSAGTHQSLPTSIAGDHVSRWRVSADGSGERIWARYAGAWHPFGTATPGPLRFRPTRAFAAGDPKLIRVVGSGQLNDYRGTITVVRGGGTSVLAVNTLPLDSYVYGVVPRESSASWRPAALQAQAVAARSYALYHVLVDPAASSYDICATSMCQVYDGYRELTASGNRILGEEKSTNAATDATKGEVLTYHGGVIFAEFSASNGGWSVDGGFPYLQAKADPWDAYASPVHNWSATVSAAQLQHAFPAVGTVRRLVIVRRDGNGDWGGRVERVRIEGVDGAGHATRVTTSGAGIVDAGLSTGMLSTWWTVDTAAAPPPLQVGTSPSVAWVGSTRYAVDENARHHAEVRRWTSGHGWSKPRGLGGTLRAGPALAVSPTGVLSVVATTADGVAVRDRSTSGTWSAWQQVPSSPTTASPAAVYDGNGRLVVAVRDANGAVRVATRGPDGWGAWTSLGGSLAANAGPALTADAAGNLMLVATDAGGTLVARVGSAGNGWAAWHPLGGAQVTGGPGAAAIATGSVLVAYRGADGQLRAGVSTNGAAVTSWTDLAGPASAGPGVAAQPSAGRADVEVVGNDGRLWRRSLVRPSASGTAAWTRWFHAS